MSIMDNIYAIAASTTLVTGGVALDDEASAVAAAAINSITSSYSGTLNVDDLNPSKAYALAEKGWNQVSEAPARFNVISIELSKINAKIGGEAPAVTKAVSVQEALASVSSEDGMRELAATPARYGQIHEALNGVLVTIGAEPVTKKSHDASQEDGWNAVGESMNRFQNSAAALKAVADKIR